ncbi:hypothetical protein LUZ60_010828 [Juncus effusus]|nr:hypothetical protein LUZ60_010828 [Juncus effusus]
MMDLRVAASSGLRLPTTNAAAMSSSSSSQIVASMFSPLYSRTRAYRGIERRSPFLGGSGMLYRSRSLEVANGDSWRNKGLPLRRAVSASFDTFAEDEDEFVKKLQELVLGGQQGDKAGFNLDLPFGNQESDRTGAGSKSELHMGDQPWQVNRMGAPDWTDRDSIAISSSMERIANSVDLPVSLRIIKQKKKKKKNNHQSGQWGDGFREAGECARSSVQKAFSSMVFMIRELHCYSLEMRQSLFYEDVKGVLERVQHEMHASFVWLFQQIFSGTPTLMVSVMLLLANFTVYSMSNTVAIAAPLPPPQTSVMSVTDSAYDHNTQPWFDQMTSNSGRTASVGGSGSGGGKVRPVTGATDDGPSSSYISNGIISQGVSVSRETEDEDEVAAWNEIVEEAYQMQAGVKDESLMDGDILKWMIAPITVQIEADGASDYVETELRYYRSIQEDPQNPLLLSNFAQFLHTVLNDHDRAEEYYKKAAGIEPADAEALSRYATFLWLAKDDISAAEETYLQAIEADPGNTYYAANYAHFLWNTGGDDTCFPLDC